jgi:glycosyltransferase involved in cell wall biosynthesis
LQAANPISLIIAFRGTAVARQERLTHAISNARETFGSVFALGSRRTAFTLSGLTAVSEEALGRGLLRRLEFLAEPEHIPYMLAPLLLRYLWDHAAVGNVVIAYPGISQERLFVAARMLAGSCEAVLLRDDDAPSIVVALGRNIRNQRLVAHWADCIERFSLAPEEQERFEPFIGSQMVAYVCDGVGSLRRVEQDFGGDCTWVAVASNITPLVRNAVKNLLPDSQLLQDDPLGNAIRVLNMPSQKVHQDPGNLITCLMFFVWLTRPDLQAAFDLSTFEGRQGFVAWFLTRGSIELRVTEEFLEPVRSERERPSAPIQAEQLTGPVETEEGFALDPASGVNLVGYPRAEMGMGEQLRLCAAALITTNLQVCVTDFNFGIIASNRDTRYEHLVRAGNPFYVNLFHINADQMRLAVEKLGRGYFRDHYNIGYWEWELSNFPDEWQEAIDLVDEIWAPSRFIQQAISKKTAKPVIWMPLAIEFPMPSEDVDHGNTRRKLGLPEHAFLFLFTFDFSSFAPRKNFGACIEAFRKAFPEADENVGLVLKTIRHPHHKREFWQLLRAIGNDARIHVIDRVLRQPEMRQLIASCDSFVSLHRSEGFGLGIAEAMYLGKPVIVTDYSGNVDFTMKNNSCLVNYRLIPVKPGEYVFPEGQVWADADVDQAAAYMRRLVEEPDYARRLGRAAASFMRQQHNSKAVGNRYFNRLKQISSARALLASPATQIENAEHDGRALHRQGLFGTVAKRLFQSRESKSK